MTYQSCMAFIYMNLKCVYLCWNPDSSIQLTTCHHLSLSFTHMLYECSTWNNPLPSSPTTLPSNHFTPATLACLLLFKCTSHALALGLFPSCFLSLTWKHLRYCLRYLLCTQDRPVLNGYFHLFTFFLFSSLSSFPFLSLPFFSFSEREPSLCCLQRQQKIWFYSRGFLILGGTLLPADSSSTQ